MLEGLGVGCTASFLAKVCPELSRSLIKKFLKTVTELTIAVNLKLFMTSGRKFRESTSSAAH